MAETIREFGKQVIETEAAALKSVAAAIDSDFERAVGMIVGCRGAVLATGVGKAGHIARKLAATFSSTGTPAHFLSPADAAHGDLGSIRQGDIVLILSS